MNIKPINKTKQNEHENPKKESLRCSGEGNPNGFKKRFNETKRSQAETEQELISKP